MPFSLRDYIIAAGSLAFMGVSVAISNAMESWIGTGVLLLTFLTLLFAFFIKWVGPYIVDPIAAVIMRRVESYTRRIAEDVVEDRVNPKLEEVKKFVLRAIKGEFPE